MPRSDHHQRYEGQHGLGPKQRGLSTGHGLEVIRLGVVSIQLGHSCSKGKILPAALERCQDPESCGGFQRRAVERDRAPERESTHRLWRDRDLAHGPRRDLCRRIVSVSGFPQQPFGQDPQIRE